MNQQSAAKQLPTVAIIGAGMSGLSLAGQLENYAEVTLFEKSRGVGGRMSTRYAGQYQFDHGAQFFTARSNAFKRFLKPLLAKGCVQPWQPRVITLDGDTQAGSKKPYKRDWFEPHYVATPRMNRLAKELASEQSLLLNTHICELIDSPQGWLLRDTNDATHGCFDWVICTTPAPQASQLIPENFNGYDEIDNADMVACYCLMLGLTEMPKINWQAARINNSSINWIAVDSSKPGRAEACSLVVHSTNSWAEQHLEDDQQIVEQQLFADLEQLLGSRLENVEFKKLHRWRYANTIEALEADCLMDSQLQLGVCGDWLIEGHVESAFLSATALAKKIIPWLDSKRCN